MKKSLKVFYIVIFASMPSDIKAQCPDIPWGEMTPAQQWDCMEDYQHETILAAYKHGLPDGIGFTKAGIKWKESLGGKFQMNIFEYVYGDYHQNAIYVAARVYKKPIDKLTKWQISRIAERLTFDKVFDDEQATIYIKILIGRHGKNWMTVWSEWNGGKGKYAEEMREIVKFLVTVVK